MYKIRKMFRFEAAHMLSSSYSEECQRVHGHSYRVEVMLTGRMLNDDGMLIDFKKLGEIVRPLIMAWDHEVIISEDRPGMPTEWVEVPFNPTAENMARYLHDKIRPLVSGLAVHVRVHETETGWAEYGEE